MANSADPRIEKLLRRRISECERAFSGAVHASWGEMLSIREHHSGGLAALIAPDNDWTDLPIGVD